MKQYTYLLIFAIFAASACQEDKIPSNIAHAEAADFEEANQVSPILPEGFTLDLWAPGPLLSNAVALTFDPQGVAYVAETARRKSSDLDIRAHRDWMIEDLSLQTIEDTRDFHLKKLATELSDQNTWQEDFNGDSLHDYRDLEVQSEYIRRVWDSDGDGRADASHLYAEGFNDMLTGVAAGILHYDNQVFLTAAPDVWRLADKNQDGLADERTKISHGYGIHIAYAGHDMSGLTMGLDGRVYWSIGDIGVNAVGPDGKRWAYPNQGAVMRCNPDGSDFEVFAHGVRNPQELAFDNYGNLLSVDNDGDHPGEHERYIHIIEGSDTGWRINWQFGKYNEPNESYKVWMDEQLSVPHFPGQAAYILPPLALAYDGPAGLAFNPGTALSEEWNEHFFASYFTASSARSKIQAFKIKPKGASFSIDTIMDVVGGIVPTGITFAADGALYINDWKDSYDKKPAGRIWKLDTPAAKDEQLRKETQELLQAGMKDKTVSELTDIIGHQDQRVRMAAQFELVKRNEIEALATSAKTNASLFGRLHAIWGIGQLGRVDSEHMTSIQALLKDPNEHIRAQTAKVIGDAVYKPALNQLIAQLEDRSASAQFFAAEALGKLGDISAFQGLTQLLAKTGDSDPHLRHAIVYALSRLHQDQAIAALANNPSVAVRIGAVVALRIMKSPLVASFLSDEDELVLAEAARAINDDLSIPEALPALAKALERTEIKNEAFIRRAINANLREASAESALRLSNYAQSPYPSEAMRIDALWALGSWAAPMDVDRVDGRYRVLKGHQIADAQAAVTTAFNSLLQDKKSDLQAAVITAAGRLEYLPAEADIYAIFKNTRQNIASRRAALTALAQLKSPNIAAALDQALLDRNVNLRKDAQSLLDHVDLREEELLAKFEKILDNNTIPEKQKALASIAKLDYPKASSLLQKWLTKLIDKKIDPALQLDVLMAIENSTFESLKTQKTAYENSIDPSDKLAQYTATLYGGDQQRGFRLFTRDQSAQCLRCHVYKGYGGAVGPELTKIATTLNREELLLSLVDPSTRIAPGYGTVILKLKDGRELAGLLQEETSESITIKIGAAPAQIIAKGEITEQETLPSGMLDMSNLLNKKQIRDVMAFLVTLK